MNTQVGSCGEQAGQPRSSCVEEPFSPRYALGQPSQQPPLVASVQEPPPRWSVL